MINPRRRSAMEGNDALFHRVSDDDDQMGAQLDDRSTGLRRRRIGSDDNDDGAPSTSIQQPSLEHSPSSISASQREQQQQQKPSHQQQSVVPLSMHLMRPFWHMSCGPDCVRPSSFGGGSGSFEDEFFLGNGSGGNHYSMTPPRRNISRVSLNGSNAADGVGQIANGDSQEERGRTLTPLRSASKAGAYLNHSPVSSVTTIPSPPTMPAVPSTLATYNDNVSIEQLLQEYTAACSIYGIPTRINPGVLTTFRFSLPTLRVSGNFFDADMLALAEVLLKHCNGTLKYIRRLDFTIAGKEGKDRGGHFGGGSGKKGIRSHGAYALSKVLIASDFIEEVYLSRNRIGPYGGSAIFAAASENASRNGKLRKLLMRGCRIGERGALAFAEEMRTSRLREVDLSANRIGFRGCFEIEKALKERMEGRPDECERAEVVLDLEGNMVFQEVMNCVTHGLGVLLGTLGTRVLHNQIDGLPPHYSLSCAIYSASIIVLYTSSTLFHSFFALKKTKFIFQVFDRCAIYLLIAGSYSPFLMIALHHEPLWSLHLLLFIWTCAICGILVEALFNDWKHKSKFSLAMYLGMGWSCMACLPDLLAVLPTEALMLLVAGGVSYTGGVPFFVRNTNMDHSIWHLFVLAGSLFHWLCVFWYVAIPPKMTDGLNDDGGQTINYAADMMCNHTVIG